MITNRINRIFKDPAAIQRDQPIFEKLFKKWQSKDFRLNKLSSNEQESLRHLVLSYPMNLLKIWTQKSLILKVKDEKPQDLFQALLGRIGVDLTEEDVNVLGEAVKSQSLSTKQTVSDNSTDKLDYQVSITLQKGSIELYPSKKLRKTLIVTHYNGLEIGFSRSKKFQWFEVDLQNCYCVIHDRNRNSKYEVLKRVETESQQNLISLIYEKSLNLLNTKESLKVRVDPLAFVYYPDLISSMKREFEIRSMNELQNLLSLEKINLFAAASGVNYMFFPPQINCFD